MMNLILVYHGVTNEIEAQTEIEDCYSDQSTLILKEDQGQICLQLISASNSDCNLLPAGIKVSIELENLVGLYSPVGYFSNFDYSSTTELCVSCSNQACIDNNFFESKAASVVIKSYTYKTQVSIGVVVREQSDLTNCINQSFIKVYSTEIQLVAEINDYCWIILAANNYQLLNSTLTLMFSGYSVQYIYSLASTNILHSVVDQQFVFTIYDASSYATFDTYDFVQMQMRMGIKQSNTLNYLLTSSTKLEIDGLPSGYSQLRLRINTDNMQLSGVPSNIGNNYAQMISALNVDAFNIKLQIQFDANTFFFESTDKQTYQNGQTQSFSCSSDLCKTNMLHVYNNIDKITSANTVTTIKSEGVILYLVTETVTSLYEGCYKGFNLNYNTEYIWFDLLINSASTTCSITTNQTYTLTLASTNATQTNVTEFSQVLNSTTQLVNISFIMTKDILAMIKYSQSTTLFVTQTHFSVDYLSLLRVIHTDMHTFYRQQLIILGVSIVFSMLFSITFHLIKRYVKKPMRKIKIMLKEFEEID
ncbi:Conserved_hypothetical protein [Hexamita inflata]|uniref:Transmembrane protein n=1 Tax=Hexamita inflata TaxID=28002 RepID=A0AA86QJA2_9EUKA|nr:Conserved hypothetical protein [Hexamita inflata]